MFQPNAFQNNAFQTAIIIAVANLTAYHYMLDWDFNPLTVNMMEARR